MALIDNTCEPPSGVRATNGLPLEILVTVVVVGVVDSCYEDELNKVVWLVFLRLCVCALLASSTKLTGTGARDQA